MGLDGDISQLTRKVSEIVYREFPQGSPEADWNFSGDLINWYMEDYGVSPEKLVCHGVLEAASYVVDSIPDYQNYCLRREISLENNKQYTQSHAA